MKNNRCRNLVLATATLLALAPIKPLAAQQKIQLKIASVAPSRSPWDIEQKELAQEWFEITKGQVSITFYDVTSLGGEKGVIQKFRSVRPGQKAPLDGVIFTTIGLNELAPDAGIYTFSIPFLIRNQKELNLVLDAYGDRLRASFRKNGFEIITWTNVGWLTFYTKDEFKDLNGLKSIKIASAGIDSPVLGNAFRTAGFTIEDVQAAKLAQELKSSGGVRGFFGVHMYAYVTGLYKSVGYALDARLSPIIGAIALTNEAWAKIPAEYKEPMLDAVARMRERLDAELDESDRHYMDAMKADGIRQISPTQAELAVWDAQFMGDYGKILKSVPGTFDPKLMEDIRALVAPTRK
jgi:TRAP-type transport system periplasmic protein